jgi:hypothetical protein
MKTKTLLTTILTSLVTLTFFTSCVTVRTTYYKNAARVRVRFESLRATRTFYDALIVRRFPAYEGRGNVCLAIDAPYSWKTTESADVIFNKAIAMADTNHDGVISEREAKAYASVKSSP